MKPGRILLLLLFLLPFRLSAATVIGMKIDGTIHSGTKAMIEDGMARVRETKAEGLLIELDTPGGMLEATREIVQGFLNTDVPIFVYVTPSGAHAGSAGTFITMAAHVAGMAPTTNIGAAHPISATGSDPEKDGGKHLAKKIENDTIAWIEGVATRRKRNPEWAKKAVLESAVIDEMKAVELHVVDFIAKDTTEFLVKANGRKIQTSSGERVLKTAGATLVPLKVAFGTKVKNGLANPAVMFVLLLIAGMGVYMEMSHPGLIFPAVAAGIAVLLLLIANSVIPLSIVGIGLILLAFGLLIGEVYVSSFGLMALGGVTAFVIGAYLLFDPEKSDLRVPRGMIWGAAAAIGAIAVIIGVAIGRTLKAKQTAGMEALIGTKAVVDKTINVNSGGRIYVNGEYWRATSAETIETGAKVEIVALDGLTAQVKKI
ncbi:MAG: nodulation protein NfeD [Pseudomonadota bacterium]